ncbi:MAG: prepilin-type N-terminal cleavage/methylation protein [Solirubrobacterales bacterium]|nr:prepilin-type N-terminal cleavage/methylation protein [Solirubrobacterales bacterium]
MLHNKLRKMRNDDEGFTLIELLVVILIIGVLAAIAIPTFLNQKGKASDANAKADVRTAQTAEETYATDNNTYGDASALQAIEPSLNGANALTAVPDAVTDSTLAYTQQANHSASNSFIATVTSSSTVVYAIVRKPDGTVQRLCKVPTTASSPGGCKVASGTSGPGTW